MKKKRKRAKRPHVRVRYVDFQELSRLSEEKLDAFKKEVRDKLIQKSIRDLIIEKELDEEEKKRKIQATRRRRRYVKYARLTKKQRECYRMYHHAGNKKRKVTLQKIADRLGIRVSSVWSRVRRAEDKIRKVAFRFEERNRLEESFESKSLYAGKLIKVMHFYFERGWPPTRIAKSLNCSLSSIYKNIETIRWLARIYAEEDRIAA